MCYRAPVALLSIKGLRLTYGGEHLLEGAELHLHRGDRCCLVGRNGAGKSTLMKIIASEILPDAGQVSLVSGARVAYLGQEIPGAPAGNALEVASGAAPLPGEGTERLPPEDEESGAERRLEAERVLTRLGVPLNTELATSSGGVIRRVLLARALAAGADILLLDEPTNHLDIETVLWLQEYLLRLCACEKRSLLFVTHDRAFAEELTSRVAELDRGLLFVYDCSYSEFLQRQGERLANEEAVRSRFEQRLAEEEAWLAKGVKARRTRNEGRLRRLQAMREERRSRRDHLGSARFGLDNASRSGELVVETKNLSFSYESGAQESTPLIEGLSTMIMRGDRVGIVGPNGAGKSTLVKLLLGELDPVEGSVRLGTGLEIVYFDQLRSQLDPNMTIYENVGGGYETVESGGRQRHLLAYLQDFLFSREDVNKQIRSLSGGERNRVLLAKLFARPANLLVLDEPTNDLDLETLELMEELLLEFRGTIILVSHDRAFLDNVVTECLVLTGEGKVEEHVGSYSDWRAKRTRREDEGSATSIAGSPRAGKSGKPKSARSDDAVRKLSFKERRELEELPERIAFLEEELEELHHRLADPALYREAASDDGGPAAIARREEELRGELENAYNRWEELEELSSWQSGEGMVRKENHDPT